MDIVFKQNKEVIRVLHKNLEEMKKNIFQLNQDGWSGNTRISMSGTSIVRKQVSNSEIGDIEKLYPNIEIQYPKKDSLLDRGPFVYFTEHER